MGGPGSGQRVDYRRRTRVEWCWVLNADTLPRPIRAGAEGIVTLRMRLGLSIAELGYLIRNDGDGFVLDTWAATTPSDAPMRFRLTLVSLPFGGARTYVHCPGISPHQPCGRRVTKLYWPMTDTRGFGCRACCELAYTSSQERRRSIQELLAWVERPRPPLPSLAAAWRRYRRLEAEATTVSARGPDGRLAGD
jgi:hypothetical protein